MVAARGSPAATILVNEISPSHWHVIERVACRECLRSYKVISPKTISRAARYLRVIHATRRLATDFPSLQFCNDGFAIFIAVNQRGTHARSSEGKRFAWLNAVLETLKANECLFIVDTAFARGTTFVMTREIDYIRRLIRFGFRRERETIWFSFSGNVFDACRGWGKRNTARARAGNRLINNYSLRCLTLAKIFISM